MSETLAYAYASGHIGFTEGTCPRGALPIIRNNRAREIVLGMCRHSYPDSAGKTHPLVPGVPEAADDDAALKALEAFIARVLATVWMEANG
jgi:hypothetical protein